MMMVMMWFRELRWISDSRLSVLVFFMGLVRGSILFPWRSRGREGFYCADDFPVWRFDSLETCMSFILEEQMMLDEGQEVFGTLVIFRNKQWLRRFEVTIAFGVEGTDLSVTRTLSL